MNFLVVFAVGDYSLTKQFETHMQMYKSYGPIVREQLGPEFNFIRLYDAQVYNVNTCVKFRKILQFCGDVRKYVSKF